MSRLLAAVVIAGIAWGGKSAAASPLADAMSRHADEDVATLREQLADVSSRCTLGAVYAQRNDLTRAALYLASCADAELPAAIASSIARITRDLEQRLRDSDLAVIEVVTEPAGMIGTIDALPDDTFTTPATLHLPAGDHQVTVTWDGAVLSNVVHAVKHSRGAVVLAASAARGGTQPTRPGVIDMSDHGALEDQHSGPPPALKHANMMPGKYQRGIAAVTTAAAPDAIADPMAVHTEPRRQAGASRLGLRLGGGMFDDDASAARAGIAVATAGRYGLAGRTFLSGRIDWSRRGGDAQPSIDVVGASAGVGITVRDEQTLAIAVLAQVRGELRLATTRTMAMTDVPVRRAGAAAALGVELAVPRTPFTAGVRLEQGLTTLIPGGRDRAMLFELGVDWR